MKIRVDFAAILASIIVLYCNGGIFAFVKGSSIVTLLIYGALFLWLVYAIMSDRAFLSKMILVCGVVLVFFLLLNVLMLIAGSDIMSLVSRMRKNIMFLLMFVAIFIYYSSPYRGTGRRTIVKIWAVDTIIAAIYTIYRLVEVPTLSRILATGSPEKYLGSGVSIAGVLGFGSIYGLVFVIIAILGLMKNVKRSYKIFMLCCAVLLAYTVLQAQFFLAAVFGVLGVILCVVSGRKFTAKKLASFVILFPLVSVIVYFVVGSWLPSLAESGALPEFIGERMMMFLEGISFAELLGTARGVVYTQSVSAIFDSWGMGILFFSELSTGEHSEILDAIAIYGIPLASLLIAGIWKIKKYISNTIPDELTRNYNIVWLLFFLMSLLNTSLWCQTTISVFLIIPLAYIEWSSDRYRESGTIRK